MIQDSGFTVYPFTVYNSRNGSGGQGLGLRVQGIRFMV
jgi:hypothetical protein